MTDLPPRQRVEPERARSVLRAYGAYAPDGDVPTEALRIVADLCAAVSDDEPGTDLDDLFARAKEAADDRG